MCSSFKQRRDLVRIQAAERGGEVGFAVLADAAGLELDEDLRICS